MLLVFFRSLFFGDYMVPDSAERIYDEVTDITLLTQQMEGYVNIYYSLCCFIAKNGFDHHGLCEEAFVSSCFSF